MKAFIHLALEEHDTKTETLTVIDNTTGNTLAVLNAEKGLCVVDIRDGERIVIGDESAQLEAMKVENEKLKTPAPPAA